MAGKSPGRFGRLSVVAATEPLPIPLPPPPRTNQTSADSDGSQVQVVHMVPPEPHFITRFPTAEPTQSQPATEAKVPERSLLTMPVVGSLFVCGCLLCGILWYETKTQGGFGWKKITEIVGGMAAEPITDEDLPYITSTPMTPVLGPIESIVETETNHAANSDPVLLSDLVADELPTLGNPTHTQRR